jgi:hypothetical protein
MGLGEREKVRRHPVGSVREKSIYTVFRKKGAL